MRIKEDIQFLIQLEEKHIAAVKRVTGCHTEEYLLQFYFYFYVCMYVCMYYRQTDSLSLS